MCASRELRVAPGQSSAPPEVAETAAYQLPLAPHPIAAEQARVLVRLACTDWKLGDVVDSVPLVTVELVTNAMKIGEVFRVAVSRQSRVTHPLQGTDLTAPDGQMRGLRTSWRSGNPPHQKARRPRKTRSVTARVGADHGTETTQKPHRLSTVPRPHPQQATSQNHAVITGEPVAVKAARRVREGVVGKGPATAGTSPTAYLTIDLPDASSEMPHSLARI